MGRDSIVSGLTYGECRTYLNRIYRMGDKANANMVLSNGQTFGDFCMKYMIARHDRLSQSGVADPEKRRPKRSRSHEDAAPDTRE